MRYFFFIIKGVVENINAKRVNILIMIAETFLFLLYDLFNWVVH